MWRRSLDSDVYTNKNLWRLWTLCLMKASHKEIVSLAPGTVIPVELLPGQFVTGRFALHEEFEKGTPENQHLSPITLWRHLKNLEKMGNLIIKTTNKYSIISIVKWEEYQGDIDDVINRRSSNDHQVIIKRSHTRSKEEEEKNTNSDDEKKLKRSKAKESKNQIVLIIDYLNKKTGSDFKDSTQDTQKHIKARLNQGFTIEDFEMVIDFKVGQWLNDSAYSEYLRPKTLFGTKMEGYLQGAKKNKLEPYTCKRCQKVFEKKVSKHEGLCDECLHKAR